LYFFDWDRKYSLLLTEDSSVKSKFIIAKIKEYITKLTKLVPEIRAIKALQILAAEYRKTNGELRSYNKLIQIGDDASGNIERKFRRVAMTASQGFERMRAGITLLSDKALTGAINDLADNFVKLLDNPQAMNDLKDTFEALGVFLKNLTAAAGIIPKFFGGLSQFVETGAEIFLHDKIRREQLKFRALEKKAEEIRTSANIDTIGGTTTQQQQGNVAVGVAVNNYVDARGRIKNTKTVIDIQQNNKRAETITATETITAGVHQ